MVENDILKKIKDFEETTDIYGIEVFDVSLWRLVRFQSRVKKLKREVGFTNSTKKVRFNLLLMLVSYMSSFLQILHILLKRRKYDNLVFAFPRLAKKDNCYFDKFTDPLIDLTDLKNVLVVQRNLGGNQYKPRFSKYSDVITSDYIDYSAKILSVLFFPFFLLLFFNKIHSVYKKAFSFFYLSRVFYLKTSLKIGEFYFQKVFWSLFILVIKAKKALFVNRELFFPHIVACKKRKTTVFELQHGITHAESPLYTGEYQQNIDPDYFLVFGNKWKGPQFSVSLDRIFNIGWAYKQWLKQEKYKVEEKKVLVVSSPDITEKILKTTFGLAKLYVDYTFIIRLHPQEELNKDQENIISHYPNVHIDDRNIDSMESILKYKYCVGENSSVLYEALTLGKKVGKIAYNGLNSNRKLDVDAKGVYYLYKKEDFKMFIEVDEVDKSSLGVYDDFSKEGFVNVYSKI